MEKETTARRKKTKKSGILGIIAAVILWAGLTGAGYWQARQYMEQTVRSIQETNALNVMALEEQITTLHADVRTLEEALAQTDKTIAGAGSVGQEVNKRIAELDEQLKELERSLKILEESGNADY